MIRRILMGLLFLSIASGVTISFAEQKNLLPNGDMENDTDGNGIPDGWNISNRNNVFWTKDIAYSGKYSIRIKEDGKKYCVGCNTKIMGIHPGALYYISGYGKAKEISNYAKMYYYWLDREGKTIGGAKGIGKKFTKTTDWEKRAITVVAPVNAFGIKITSLVYCKEEGPGEFWVDDFRIVEVCPPSQGLSKKGGNLLFNSDFEIADPSDPSKPVTWRPGKGKQHETILKWENEGYRSNKSVSIENILPSDVGFWYSYGRIPFKSNTKYTITLYYKFRDKEGRGFYIFTPAGVKEVPGKGKFCDLPTEWTKFSFTFTTPEKVKPTNIALSLYTHRSQQKVWFDKVTLVEGEIHSKTPSVVKEKKKSFQKVDTAKLKLVGTALYPHGWGVNFVKKGNYIFQTKSESDRKLAVIDVSSPQKMKLITEIEAGYCATRNICLHNNIILCNSYQYILPIDISNPKKPKELKEHIWQPDKGYRVRPFYSFEWRGKYLYLACADLSKGFRVYKVDKPFKPILIATIDLSSYSSPENKKLLQKTWYPNSELLFSGNIVYVSYGTLLAIIDITNSSSPKLLTCYDAEENIESITLSSSTLYLSLSGRKGDKLITGRKGVVALDVSNPVKPYKLGRYRDMEIPERILAVDNTLFIVGMETIPEKDKNINGIPFTEGIASIYKYRPVLHIVDISNPSRMKKIADYPFPLRWLSYQDSVCRKIEYDKGFLYVADHTFGIRVFDVRNKLKPKEIGKICTITQETNKLILSKKFAYATGPLSMIPIDISNPKNPKINLRNIIFFPGANTLGMIEEDQSKYIYSVSKAYKEIIVCSIENPESPRIVNLIELPEGALWYSLAEVKGYIYVVGNGYVDTKGTFPLCVFKRINEGKNLHLITKLNLQINKKPEDKFLWGVQRGFCIKDNHLYLVGYVGIKDSISDKHEMTALITLDISKPETPRVIGSFATDEVIPGGRLYQTGPAYYNGYLYFFNARPAHIPENKFFPCLCVFDMRNPEKPVLVSKTPIKETPEEEQAIGPGYTGIASLSPYPYLVLQHYTYGLRLVDINNPKEPRFIWWEKGRLKKHYQDYSRYGWGSIFFYNGYLYISRLDHLDIFEFTSGK